MTAIVPSITPQDAAALHGKKGVVFLDVREPGEVAAGKIAGAIEVPSGVVPVKAAEVIPKGATVLIYCAAGGRAGRAGQTLKEMGWSDVRNLGGFKDWAEAGLPVE
jgi:rhodanese-related sulfurtransferase